MRPSLRNLIIGIVICAVIIGAGLAQAGYYYKLYNEPFDFSDDNIGSQPVALIAESQQMYNSEYKSADSADEIIARSDCVLRVRVNPGYEFIDYHFLSSADVLETLYGKAPEYERIYIYEPVMVVTNTLEEGGLYVEGVQNKLYPGQEYVIALKKLDFQKGSFMPEHEDRVYVYTDMICSAFPCGHEPKCRVYNMRDYSEDYRNGKEPLRYRDVREFDYCGSKSLINGAMWLYDSMVEKFGEEAFGFAPGEYRKDPETTPAAPTEEIPERTVEWLAAELVRRSYQGRIALNKYPDYSDIMDRNDDTELLRTAIAFETVYAGMHTSSWHVIAFSIKSADVLQTVNETEDDITAKVCVAVYEGYEEEEAVGTVELVFTITVNKERMMITGYDRPEDDGSIYSRLKALALSYEGCSWTDACKKALDELIASLDEDGYLP